MAKTHALSANTRKRSGSGALTSLRAEGLIPGVVYGKDLPAANIRLNRKTLETVLHHSVSEHILVNLTLDDAASPTLALIKDVQHDPLNGNVLHVDFHAIRESDVIHSIVPLELTGECVGAKAGGLVEHLVHNLHISCLPKDLPDQIHVDISAIEIGGSLHTRELTLPAGVTTQLGAEVVIMLVAAPRVVEVVAVAAVDPKAKKKGGKK
jgi:large subunit ribosomal protein L25